MLWADIWQRFLLLWQVATLWVDFCNADVIADDHFGLGYNN